jgi:hypothetical protein
VVVDVKACGEAVSDQAGEAGLLEFFLPPNLDVMLLILDHDGLRRLCQDLRSEVPEHLYSSLHVHSHLYNGIMEIADFTVPGESLTISPIGDIQYGGEFNQDCDVDKLKRHIAFGNKNGWYYIGMGDYLDVHSPSQRKVHALHRPGSSRDVVDAGVTAWTEELAGLLEGRWLGAIRGDHYHDFEDGQNCDSLLARKLKTPFLGTAAFVQVRFEGYKRPLKLWVFHGKMTSSTNPTGLTLEFARKQAAFDADIYLMGHAHQLYRVRRDVLVPYKEGRTPKIGHRDVVYCATGSFLNGWTANRKNGAGWPEGSYVEQMGLTPLPTGAPVITVQATKKYGHEAFEIRCSA